MKEALLTPHRGTQAVTAPPLRRTSRAGLVPLLLLSAVACAENGITAPDNSMQGASGGNGPIGMENGAGTGSTVIPPVVDTNPPITDTPLDVNRVGIHRLNRAEYDNTVRDLLGVASTPASTFIADEKLHGFDNIAAAFGMTEAQFEQYYNAADVVVEAAFADPTLAARIMTCTPAGAADTACIGQILTTFGARAWRRPLTPAEITRLTQVATDAMALGEDGVGGIKQVAKAMLSSVPFLYRIELDPNPASLEPHPVGAYELASRLSYLGWSTMPDDELFSLAQSGQLLTDEVLSAQVDRLLADSRADNFVANFAGQWLGMRDLLSHQVEGTVFPNWSEELRSAMVEEGLLYFKEFMNGRVMTDFFTTDVNFVNATLGELYGMPGAQGETMTPVTITTDQRVGFMGLAAFLTHTSFPYRTAPTLRGKWVMDNLLCQTIPAPPPNVPELDDENANAEELQSENVRIRLEAHRADPMCANCHKLLDPIGMGLENFDGIGAYRTNYANGDAVDPSGELPDGQQFQTLEQLANLLSVDSRLTDCASQKLLTYALSREVVASDTPYLNQIRAQWSSGAMGIRELLKQIVLNDTFRFRRGETETGVTP